MNDKTQTTLSVEERWFRPVNRLGRITETIAMAASFFPFLYLYLTYREFPPLSTFFAALGGVSAAFVAGWIVEPISYFPSLGTAGTYMGILAGSIGQMRVPSAIVAKNVAGVEENTQEAEIVGTCGVAGSIILKPAVTTLTALGGSVIIAALPKVVLSTLSAYVLPSMFGAVLAMFTGPGRLQMTIPTIVISVALNLAVKYGIIPIPAWSLMILTVVIGIVVGRVCYKLKLAS
jgi:hypothetical protein